LSRNRQGYSAYPGDSRRCLRNRGIRRQSNLELPDKPDWALTAAFYCDILGVSRSFKTGRGWREVKGCIIEKAVFYAPGRGSAKKKAPPVDDSGFGVFALFL
jgi:hypothetical protein